MAEYRFDGIREVGEKRAALGWFALGLSTAAWAAFLIGVLWLLGLEWPKAHGHFAGLTYAVWLLLSWIGAFLAGATAAALATLRLPGPKVATVAFWLGCAVCLAVGFSYLAILLPIRR